MRIYYIYLTLCFSCFTLHSQSPGFQNVVIESVDDLCFGHQSQSADVEAESIVDEIMGQMGLNRNFKIRKCSNIKNALAHIEEDENKKLTPYILYDPEWLAQMSKKSNTDWASIGVLAHEVGHFLLYHSLNKRGSNPRWELSADRFAGTTLARMGSTLEEAQSMFKNIPEKGSSTHPGRAERMNAIKIGWMKFNNPAQKKIILNENTPEREINPELIVNRYYKSLGGLKTLSQIKQLNYTEKISETIGENLNQKPLEYGYSYEQTPNKILITNKKYNEQYLIINNDSLLWKYTDQKKWKNEVPRIGTSVKQDFYSFKKDKVPTIKNFFDDFVLVSNPELALYRGRKRIADEECFVLELPTENTEIGNLKKKGKRISVAKKYFFNTLDGLLYGIETREKTSNFVRGKIKSQKNIKTQKIFISYKPTKDILFPSQISTTETELFNDLPRGKTRYQKRIITNLILNAKKQEL
ncbi:hypothetical protein CLV91_0724 [Maribacter vaceletii]|uniref:Putative metallopeptidase domain-containing protein n=1 Tax=Maribacter vaceletii TaxID=1206816 RepID=A0A495ECW3_9FLAO|nr:hypothetical protein [Maribacter vaceletii]RKR14646.1 hypothetical protein CLV91_0724 [Maribacter vaceletii]